LTLVAGSLTESLANFPRIELRKVTNANSMRPSGPEKRRRPRSMSAYSAAPSGLRRRPSRWRRIVASRPGSIMVGWLDDRKTSPFRCLRRHLKL
jgi:hypothetical protein